MLRARVERDGVYRVGALTSDRRQVRHLRRLAGLLAEDAALTVTMGEGTDGATYLTAAIAGTRPPGLWGDVHGVDRPADVTIST